MINIAELLKDVPTGMKLYSPLFGEVNFVGIDKQSDYPIDVTDCKGNLKSFTEFGVYFADNPDAECLLFPSKDCRTWEGLKVPVKPKFKVGDEIKTGNQIDTIALIGHATRSYYCESGRTISFENQDLWHLVSKSHYDISNFKPFDKVLVRDGCEKWGCEIFSLYEKTETHPFITCASAYKQCVPFEGNEHLLGTTDMPSEEYINW